MNPQDAAVRDIVDLAPDSRDYLRLLREQTASGPGVIPFVGAGLSVPFGYKGWTAFLNEQAVLADCAAPVSTLISEGKYEEAAELVKEARGDATFEAALEAEYASRRLTGASLDQGAAATLPRMFVGPVVTTNFDHVLEEAFQAAGQPFERAAWGANVSQTDKAFREDRHLLLKIHGDVEEASSRIFTRSEYARHYRTASGENFSQATLPTLLEFMFTARRLLFLGCSLGPDRTLDILARARQTHTGTRHFALVEAPADDTVRRARHKFLGDRGILPIWYPPNRHDLIEPILSNLLETIPAARRPQRRAPSAPGVLSGAFDARLQHRAGWFGRQAEVQKVLAFLNGRQSGSGPRICIVEGAPGIGKTEVCREALHQYLEAHGARPVLYVDLLGVADDAAFLARIAESLGISGTADRKKILHGVSSAAGVVYLDNLEGVLRDNAALETAREIEAISDVRLLASSRRRVPDRALNVRHVPIGVLGKTDAVRLFIERWRSGGSREPLLESDEAVRTFVIGELGCHTLTIVLVAAQCWRFGSFALLQQEWQSQPLRVAVLEDDDPDGIESSQTSLTKSLQLTLNAIQGTGGIALGVWGLMAFFPVGVTRSAWTRITKDEPPAWERGRSAALSFYIVEIDQQGTLRMLAPIRQFIFQAAGGGLSGPFVREVGARVYNYFSQLAHDAQHEDPSKRLAARTALLDEFANLQEFVAMMTTADGEWPDFLADLSASIANFYQLRPLLGLSMLEKLLAQQERAGLQQAQALSTYLLGTLKVRLGQRAVALELFQLSEEKFVLTGQEVGAATVLQDRGDLKQEAGRLQDAYELYMQALKVYEKASDNIGIANIHLRVGNLHLRARRPADVRERDAAAQTQFAKALELFRAAGTDLGTANVLRSQGDLLRYQGRVDDARDAYAQAMLLFRQAGDPLGIANTHRSLGEIAFDLEDWVTANAKYLEAREAYRQAATPMGLAQTCAQLALIAHRMNDREACDRYLREASEAATASGVPAVEQFVASVRASIGGAASDTAGV